MQEIMKSLNTLFQSLALSLTVVLLFYPNASFPQEAPTLPPQLRETVEQVRQIKIEQFDLTAEQFYERTYPEQQQLVKLLGLLHFVAFIEENFDLESLTLKPNVRIFAFSKQFDCSILLFASGDNRPQAEFILSGITMIFREGDTDPTSMTSDITWNVYAEICGIGTPSPY